MLLSCAGPDSGAKERNAHPQPIPVIPFIGHRSSAWGLAYPVQHASARASFRSREAVRSRRGAGRHFVSGNPRGRNARARLRNVPQNARELGAAAVQHDPGRLASTCAFRLPEVPHASGQSATPRENWFSTHTPMWWLQAFGIRHLITCDRVAPLRATSFTRSNLLSRI